jgi:hypothetical protein
MISLNAFRDGKGIRSPNCFPPEEYRGILYYWLPMNYNPHSILYAAVNSVEDLDKIGEKF